MSVPSTEKLFGRYVNMPLGISRIGIRMNSFMVESLRKTYKYRLKPTPEQERALDGIVLACRRLYNTALEQRIILYRQRGVSLSRYEQEAELKALRAGMPAGMKLKTV